LRWVPAEELRAGLDLDSLIDALETGHRGARPELTEGLIGPDEKRYLIRSAHDGRAILGSKLITIVPDNPVKRGLPSVQAVIILFDAETGVPRTALDATELTYWKTAADSALGARFLSRPDAKTLLIAGAGGLAPWLVRSHLLSRPGLEKILLWNRTPGHAMECANKLSEDGIEVQMISDLEDGVRQADIISTATMAKKPILSGEWLKPGAHVDLVGGYSEDTREADDETVRCARLFVDCLPSALEGVGDILAPLKFGVISKQDIEGDLYDLAGKGVSGGRKESDITVFKNAGGAHLDLMVASAVLARLEKGARA
jgi:ornithine cyclodeaminase